MDHIGIDVHKKESQICILAEGSELIERRILTQLRRFGEALGGRSPARILLESSTESEWVARCLEALGHAVIVADPNFAPMYATRTRKVKTDRRDARALAEACLLGAYRAAHRLSDAQRHVRARLAVRDTLVRTRTRYISLIRALLRQHGWQVPSGSAEGFPRRVRALPLPGRLRSEVAPLLAMMRHLQHQLAYSDERITAVTQTDERVPPGRPNNLWHPVDQLPGSDEGVLAQPLRLRKIGGFLVRGCTGRKDEQKDQAQTHASLKIGAHVPVTHPPFA